MSTEQPQQKQARFETVKKHTRKVLLPAVVGAGILFPVGVYAEAALTDSVHERSDEISKFLDNRPAKIVAAVTMAAGIALTINGYKTGQKYDERKMHALRVAGPALLTAAAGAALIDSQTSINYAIPAGLAYAGLYLTALTNSVSIFERTVDKGLRVSTIASSSTIAVLGATVFLAAADKL